MRKEVNDIVEESGEPTDETAVMNFVAPFASVDRDDRDLLRLRFVADAALAGLFALFGFGGFFRYGPLAPLMAGMSFG